MKISAWRKHEKLALAWLSVAWLEKENGWRKKKAESVAKMAAKMKYRRLAKSAKSSYRNEERENLK